MQDGLKKLLQASFSEKHFDADWLAFGILNFKDKSSETIILNNGKELSDKVYFDLASLTKPLALSLMYFQHKECQTKEMRLLLEHQAGLPTWGLLSNKNWKEEIKKYPIHQSETQYSDFSAIRFMLEAQHLCKESALDSCTSVWGEEVLFWKNLMPNFNFPETGQRNGRPIKGAVHDPNAFNIGEFLGHAGLFGTIEGVVKCLFNFDQQFGLLNKMKTELSDRKHRFVLGWDTVENSEDTLAGNGATKYVFGHLGFTGTSIWIDANSGIGHVLLTNATKRSWYHKDSLNQLRKSIGTYIW